MKEFDADSKGLLYYKDFMLFVLPWTDALLREDVGLRRGELQLDTGMLSPGVERALVRLFIDELEMMKTMNEQ